MSQVEISKRQRSYTLFLLVIVKCVRNKRVESIDNTYDDLTECTVTLLQVQADHHAKEHAGEDPK